MGKRAVESYFPEFIEFYFPKPPTNSWARGYQFLDQELRAVVQDAELGKRFVDKLAKKRCATAASAGCMRIWKYKGSAQAELPKRMFVYNYRLFDRYRQPVASLAVLADTTANWRPNHLDLRSWAANMNLRFPAAKLLDYAAQQDLFTATLILSLWLL